MQRLPCQVWCSRNGRRVVELTVHPCHGEQEKNAFFRYTSIIGDGLRARNPAGQGREVILGCEILSRMTELDRPVSYRIGR